MLNLHNTGHQLALLAALTIWLVGCSTTQQRFSDSMEVPFDRILAPSMVAQRGQPVVGQAILEVGRDPGQMGSACRYDFSVDDMVIATIGSGEGLRIQVPPGRHLLKLEMGGRACQTFATSIFVEAKEGQTLPIRLGIDEGRPFVRRL